MLKGIDPLLTPHLLRLLPQIGHHDCPDLPRLLAEMGHDDALVLADANFIAMRPGAGTPVLRLPGVGLVRALQAVTSLLALGGEKNPNPRGRATGGRGTLCVLRARAQGLRDRRHRRVAALGKFHFAQRRDLRHPAPLSAVPLCRWFLPDTPAAPRCPCRSPTHAPPHPPYPANPAPTTSGCASSTSAWCCRRCAPTAVWPRPRSRA